MTYDEELLVILMEECGELIQECSKLIRTGAPTSEAFEKEVADVMCLLDLAHQNDMFSYNHTDVLQEQKLEKLRKWSNLLGTDV